MSYDKALEVIRDTPGPYLFQTVLKLITSIEVIEADHHTVNFGLKYGFLDDGEIPGI